ncbi:MAG TPA: DUF2341 domain-containing protein [Fibrobacteria bacterium]|nr:DUF2341 domain-containing protein [Fibrobacteria bacterium]
MRLRTLKAISALAVCGCLASVLGCLFEAPGEPVAQGGGSSETTNGVVMGFVTRPDGTPAQNARVVLRPRNFLKDTSLARPKSARPGNASRAPRLAETTTDGQGRYAIDSVGPGDYYLEANDRDSLATVRDFSAGDRDTIFLDSIRLRPTGVVVGHVNGDLTGISEAVVQIYGLDRVAKVDSATGQFSFPDLPEGSYTLRASVPSSPVEAREIAGVAAHSSDTNFIDDMHIASFEEEDYASWAYSRRILINTTASGADVKGPVAGFPLLVRLTNGNFDFSLSDGRDVRFSGGDGKRLRYQVERWDAAAHLAEIWVKVDTIHGNSRSDAITMHFGKAGAPDWSDDRHVFDSADGYGGVWHLAEEAADTLTKGLYKDASPAAQNGDDRIRSTSVQGIIGPGHGFDLGDYVKSQPSYTLRPAREIVISAWFRGKATGSYGSTVASLGDSYGLRIVPNGSVLLFVYKGNASGAWTNLLTSGVNVLDSAWHHLAGTYDGSTLRIYVDGVGKAAMAWSAPIPYTLGPDFFIGRHGTSKRIYDFTGSLDEVVILNRIRDANWMKLCFESQRLNPTLLEFQTP